MATGGEVGGTNEQRSDGAEDYRCSVCNKNGQTTEASHYCTDCDTCYCKACLCDHAVLGRSKVEQLGNGTRTAGKASDQSVEEEVMCLRHPQYKVEIYCSDHDVLCCQMCPSTDHRSCKDMEKLVAVAYKSNLTDDVQHIQEHISGLEGKLESIKRNSLVRRRFTESSHINYLSQLREMKEKLDAKYDKVKKESYSRKKHYIDKFNTDQVLCDNIKGRVPSFKRDLDPEEDHAKYFVKVKRAREWVAGKHEEMDSIAKATVTGVFENIRKPDEDNALDTVSAAVNIRMSEMKFSVATRDDTTECEIVGICQLENGIIIIADKANKCLKQLDDAYSVISQYKLQDSPLDICATGEAEVAVALENKSVLLLTAGTEYENVRTLDMAHKSLQVAYHNEHLYIIISFQCHCDYSNCRCERQINLYDKSGKSVKDIDITQIHRHCKDQQSIAISPTGDRLYVACHCSHIFSLDSNGTNLKSWSKIPGVVCLFVDKVGQLLASQSGSNEVIKLSQRLKKVKTVMTYDKSKPGPGAMFYDKNLRRIVVGSRRGEYIHLVQI